MARRPSSRNLASSMMPIMTDEGIIEILVTKRSERSAVGRYWNAVQALENGDPGPIHKLKRVTVRDARGVRHRLLTDERELRVPIRRGDTVGIEVSP